MATIVATNMQGFGQKTITKTTLGASDTFVFDVSKNQLLILDNVTGGSLTPLLVGDAAAVIGVSGFGDVDASTVGSFGRIPTIPPIFCDYFCNVAEN